MSASPFQDLVGRNVLVTGCAGFIGLFVVQRLLQDGYTVTGIDNLNGYYDPRLKRARLAQLQGAQGFSFHEADIADHVALDTIVKQAKPDAIINLAAQAGVRYSLQNPRAYVDSNVVGFLNILEACRHNEVRHLVYASTSSVYGANPKMPFSVSDNVDHPVSLYAATKKSNELMAHAYSHLYGLPVTGLRFFTVYGPWGRPDMAYYIFTQKVLAGEPIDVFNHGRSRRDFTYVDDIVEGIVQVLARVPRPDPTWGERGGDPATSTAPYRLYNIGNNTPEPLSALIEAIEDCCGRKAEKRYLPAQPGDVDATWADIDALQRDTGFRPTTPLRHGIERFVRWYREYHGI